MAIECLLSILRVCMARHCIGNCDRKDRRFDSLKSRLTMRCEYMRYRVRDNESPCQVLLLLFCRYVYIYNYTYKHITYRNTMICVFCSLGRFQLTTLIGSMSLGFIQRNYRGTQRDVLKIRKRRRKKSEQHSDLFWQHAVLGLRVSLEFHICSRAK